MKIMIMCLFFSAQLFSQTSKVAVPYKYGYEGIELIAKTKADSTIVYSHRGAKATIRTEVGNNIVKLYSNGHLKNGLLTISIQRATVTGKIKIKRRGKLISIMFTWIVVKWSTGLIEEYRPKQKRK
jgi:hypothetical protein